MRDSQIRSLMNAGDLRRSAVITPEEFQSRRLYHHSLRVLVLSGDDAVIAGGVDTRQRTIFPRTPTPGAKAIPYFGEEHARATSLGLKSMQCKTLSEPGVAQSRRKRAVEDRDAVEARRSSWLTQLGEPPLLPDRTFIPGHGWVAGKLFLDGMAFDPGGEAWSSVDNFRIPPSLPKNDQPGLLQRWLANGCCHCHQSRRDDSGAPLAARRVHFEMRRGTSAASTQAPVWIA